MRQLVPKTSLTTATPPVAAEFFAGIGLVRIGLEKAGFSVDWSNDIDKDKHAMYKGHFRKSNADHKFVLGDIGKVNGEDIPKDLAMAWASFPCTDLSLAGWRRGLGGKHSGTFYHFTRILGEIDEDRRPSVVALENVVGLATSHGGTDLAAAVRELNDLGYSVDVLTLDARRFVPQSRPRLFLVGVKEPPKDDESYNDALRPQWLRSPFADSELRTHRAILPDPPAMITSGLSELVEEIPPNDELWWDDKRTDAFLSSLSPIQSARLDVLRSNSHTSYRSAYRRTRNGIPVWEIRRDDVAGCLRTARGGSSKQALVKVGTGRVSVRWMTALEYARLMGAGDYNLSGLRRNQALFGFGDAVCVPAVTWLAENYLMPLIEGKNMSESEPLPAVANA